MFCKWKNITPNILYSKQKLLKPIDVLLKVLAHNAYLRHENFQLALFARLDYFRIEYYFYITRNAE